MAEKPIYAVGLDAGSTRTRMVVCALEEQLRLLGCGPAARRRRWIEPDRDAVGVRAGIEGLRPRARPPGLAEHERRHAARAGRLWRAARPEAPRRADSAAP